VVSYRDDGISGGKVDRRYDGTFDRPCRYGDNFEQARQQ